MASETIRIHGIRELNRALKKYDDGLRKELEVKLKDSGGIVERSATAKFAGIDPTEPSRFSPRVKGFGRVVVTRTRSKGRRGDFGALLMRRALLPALTEEAPRVLSSLENMLDTLGRDF